VRTATPRFSADAGESISDGPGSEFQRLAYLDLANQGYRFLTTANPVGVDEFDLSPDDRWIALRHERGGVGTLHVLKPPRPAPSDAFQAPGRP